MAVVILAGLFALTAAGGYLELFSTFAPYDDEGYFLVSVHHMLKGYALYDEIPCAYGPLYYLFKGLVHGVLAWPLTNDGTRFLTLGLWLMAAAGCGAAVYRQAGRMAAGLAAYLLAFHQLASCVGEPGHPQELAALLLAGVILLPSALEGRRLFLGAAMGAVAGALLLVKVNLGVYALVAISGLGATASAPGRLRSLLRIAVASGTISLPWVLMRSNLAGESYGPYAVYATVVSMSVLGLLLVGFNTSARVGVGLDWRAGLAALGGWIGAVGLIVAATTATGTSLERLFKGVVLRPLQFLPTLTDFGWPPNMCPGAAITAGASALTAVVILILRKHRPAWAASLIPVLKIGYGVAVIACVGMGRDAVFQYAPPWAWLVLLPGPGRTFSAEALLARLALAWWAVPQLLVAYPVPGSQIAFGTYLLIPVAILCLWDGLNGIRPWHAPAGGARWRFVRAVCMAAVAMGSLLPWLHHVRTVRWQYMATVPLDLPGAARLRVAPPLADTYRGLTSLLRENADTFLCTIGLNSLYAWTGLEPPCRVVISDDVAIRTPEEQHLLITSLLSYPRPIMVCHTNLFNRDNADTPFFRLIRERFSEWKTLGGYSLLVPVRPGRSYRDQQVPTNQAYSPAEAAKPLDR